MSLQNTTRLTTADFLARMFAPEVRAWRGQEPLWKVFWGYGVVASGVVVTLYAFALYAGHLASQEILLLFSIGYSTWILVSVWRCADNTSERFWGLMARLLTVAWAGNIIMVLMFLQLDLIGKYFGR